MNYNWDNINCASPNLDDSNQFFAVRHLSHEPANRIQEYLQQQTTDENNPNALNKLLSTPIKWNGLAPAVMEDIRIQLLRMESRKILQTMTVTQYESTDVCAINNANNGPANIRSTVLQKICSKTTDTPDVCKYVKIYEKKKQYRLDKVAEEEKKIRIFHSKPAPNFKIIHYAKKPIPEPIQVTIPNTPAVLKKSKQSDELKKKLREQHEKNMELPKFTARPPRVLQQEPFKPKLEHNHKVKLEPFDLHVNRRLEERKRYDEMIKKVKEEKIKQDEYEKKKREEELVRKIRKNTEFKARPNPFK